MTGFGKGQVRVSRAWTPSECCHLESRELPQAPPLPPAWAQVSLPSRESRRGTRGDMKSSTGGRGCQEKRGVLPVVVTSALSPSSLSRPLSDDKEGTRK